MSKELIKKEQGVITVGKQKYLPTTLREFLTIYSPNKVKRDLETVKTVRQALTVSTPVVATMVRQYGVEKVEAYLKIWLIELNEIINAKRHLTEPQIDETAYQIVSNYRNVSIADINIIFQKAKRGEYGALYESLSIDKILSWFSEYYNDRCNTAGEMTRQAHDKIKYQQEKEEQRSGGRRSVRFEEGMKEAIHKYNLEQMQKKYNNENKK